MNRILARAGVLARPPEEWTDSPRLESMPWGGKPIRACAPRPPGGVQGLWPQPPIVAQGLYPPVLHLDRAQSEQHRRDNVLRYTGQLVTKAPIAGLRALRGRRLQALDDREFARIIGETCFAQFICPRLDPDESQTFAEHLRGPIEDYAKVDCAAVDPARALPGLHAAPTVTLLRRSDGGELRPVAIAIDGRVLDPGDGAAWTLARYFVLQGLQYLLVLVFHPRLHFPNDAINAITRSLLPRQHPLFRLLAPHLDLTLGLHAAVIHHRRSVLHNSQREIYTPFPVSTEGIHEGVRIGAEGIPGKCAYAPYHYQKIWMDRAHPYGRYRSDWCEAITGFAERVLAGVASGDPWVARWADAIAEWVSGFPDARAIAAEGALARAAAVFIVTGSVFHTADHHSYASIPLQKLPWRLRRGPLRADEDPQQELDLQALVSPEDFFRHQLCHSLFFAPCVIRSLRDLKWSFAGEGPRAAIPWFRGRMDELDDRWAESGFPRSAEIASSAQY